MIFTPISFSRELNDKQMSSPLTKREQEISSLKLFSQENEMRNKCLPPLTKRVEKFAK